MYLREDKSPTRGRLARRVIQSYRFRRGKDRLFLIFRYLLRLPQVMIVDITPDIKLRLDLDDYLQRWMYCHHVQDEPDYYLISQIVRAGDYFVDVGANIGIVSLIASRAVGDTGKVYAIEALAQTRALLEDNIQLNDAKNVKILSFALMDKNTATNIYPSTDGNIGGSSLSSVGIKGPPEIIEGRTFDSLLADKSIEKCDILKMDIEGAEILAIQGMKRLFVETKPRAVIIEVSDAGLSWFSSTPDEIITFFCDHGYIWYEACEGRLRKLDDLNIRGYRNLWAIQPAGIEARFLTE